MKAIRDNGLTVALLVLFAISIVGHAWAGWLNAVVEMGQHHVQAPSLGEYLTGGEFLSTVFENWESEFLQMAAYVVLTAHLFQRGSAESNDPDEPQDLPIRGGFWKKLYAHSLGLALFVLFLISFALHLVNSARDAADQAALHGDPTPTLTEHFVSAQLWFIPELAERVLVDGGAGGAVNLPARAWIAGIKEGRRSSRKDRHGLACGQEFAVGAAPGLAAAAPWTRKTIGDHELAEIAAVDLHEGDDAIVAITAAGAADADLVGAGDERTGALGGAVGVRARRRIARGDLSRACRCSQADSVRRCRDLRRCRHQ